MSTMRETVSTSSPSSGTSRFTGIVISFITAIIVFAVGQTVVGHLRGSSNVSAEADLVPAPAPLQLAPATPTSAPAAATPPPADNPAAAQGPAPSGEAAVPGAAAVIANTPPAAATATARPTTTTTTTAPAPAAALAPTAAARPTTAAGSASGVAAAPAAAASKPVHTHAAETTATLGTEPRAAGTAEPTAAAPIAAVAKPKAAPSPSPASSPSSPSSSSSSSSSSSAATGENAPAPRAEAEGAAATVTKEPSAAGERQKAAPAMALALADDRHPVAGGPTVAGSDKPTDKDVAREAWRRNLPDISGEETRASVLIPIKGSIEGATYHVSTKPKSVIINLPKAESLITMRFYKIKREGFGNLWIKQEDGEGTTLRLMLNEAVAPQVEIHEDYIRINVRKPTDPPTE